jgi:hypothetical protein
VGLRLDRQNWPSELEVTHRLAGPLDGHWSFAEGVFQHFEKTQAEKQRDPALTPQGVQQALESGLAKPA